MGTFLWENKKKAYIGNFHQNKMHGKGKIVYSTNQIVEGEWESNHNILVTKEENDPSATSELEEIIKDHDRKLKE